MTVCQRDGTEATDYGNRIYGGGDVWDVRRWCVCLGGGIQNSIRQDVEGTDHDMVQPAVRQA